MENVSLFFAALSGGAVCEPFASPGFLSIRFNRMAFSLQLRAVCCRELRVARVKSRFLRESEKRDVVVAVMEVLKKQNPGCKVHVEVADWTDERGVPQYTATISTVRNDAPG